MAEERKQRYTEAARAEQAATRRQRTAGAKYGTSYYEQGIRPEKEKGLAFLRGQELKKQFGAFANPTWNYQVRDGVVYRMPFANQTGRIAEQGGTGPQWEVAPDYVQRSYSNPRRQAFFSANPDAGQDEWLYHKYIDALPTDENGMRVNQYGDTYDPYKVFQQMALPSPSGTPARRMPTVPPQPPPGTGGFQLPGAPPGTPPIIGTVPWPLPQQQGGNTGISGMGLPTFPFPQAPQPQTTTIPGGGYTGGQPWNPQARTGAGQVGVPQRMPIPGSGPFIPQPGTPQRRGLPGSTGQRPTGPIQTFGGGNVVPPWAQTGIPPERQVRRPMPAVPTYSAAQGFYSPALPAVTQFLAHPGEEVMIRPRPAMPYVPPTVGASPFAPFPQLPRAGTSGGIDTSTQQGQSQGTQNTQQQQLQQSQGTSNSTYGSNTANRNQFSNRFSNAPVITKQFQPLVNEALKVAMGRLTHGGLPEGYAQRGLIQSNRVFDTLGQGLENRLAATGALGGPGQAAGQSYLEGERGKQIADFLSNLPLVQRDLQNQDLGLAQGLAAAFGRGEAGTQSGTSFGTSDTTGYADTVTQALSQLLGQSQSQNQNIFQNVAQNPYHKPPGQGIGGLLGGLAGLIPGMGLLGGLFGGNRNSNPYPGTTYGNAYGPQLF